MLPLPVRAIMEYGRDTGVLREIFPNTVVFADGQKATLVFDKK